MEIDNKVQDLLQSYVDEAPEHIKHEVAEFVLEMMSEMIKSTKAGKTSLVISPKLFQLSNEALMYVRDKSKSIK